MRITVNLDTCAVTTMPSPFRMKAASLAQVEVQFTRAAVVVPLPMGSAIEFGIKAKNQTDTPPLVYCNTFSATAGTLYAANVNLATVELEQALGIGDGDVSNDKAQVELVGEVGWSMDGINLFRSQTFTVIVEAPIISGGAPSLYNPPRYPILDGNVLHFVRGDGTLGTVSGGMTTLTTYTGNIGTALAPAGNIYGTFIGNGSGLTTLNPNALNASSWNGCAIGSNDFPLDTITAWHFVGRGSACFEGDGSGLTGVNSAATLSSFDAFFADSMGTTYGGMNVGVSTPLNEVHANSFYGDGTNLSMGEGLAQIVGSYPWIVKAIYNGQQQDVRVADADHAGNSDYSGNASNADWAFTASVATSAYNVCGGGFNEFFSTSNPAPTSMDIGSAGYPLAGVYANYFEGDGSGLWGIPPNMNGYTGNIGESYSPVGAIYATSIYGDGGAGLTAAYAYTSGGAQVAQQQFNNFFSSITNYGSMDIGQSGGAIQNVYAQYFYGDGSGLTNVGGGGDVSSWGTPDIGSLGPVFGNTSGNFFDPDGHVGFAGHSGFAANSPNDFFPFYTRLNFDFGEASNPLGTVYANSFVGDGSGLTNVGSGDFSSYTGDIGQYYAPAGAIYAYYFYGDGSALTNVPSNGPSLGYQNLGSSGAPCAVVYADNLNVGNFVLTNTSPAPETAGSVYFNGTDFLGYDGANWKAFSGGAMPDLSDYGGNIGTYSTPAGSFYGTVGDSDHFNASAFVTYIEAERVAAQNFTVYTAMTLPTETFTGSIVYSRHAGGHFYGLTDDGWKQLDNT